LAAVTVNSRALAAVDRVEHLHDHCDISAAIILPRTVDVHIAQSDVIEPVAVMKCAHHRLAGDFRGAIEVLVVERMILGHRFFYSIAIDRCRGGVGETLYSLLDTGFEHVERPANIYVEGGARKIVALQEPQCSEMKYAVGPIKRLCQDIRLTDVAAGFE